MKVNTLEVVWHKKEAIHAFDTVGTDDDNTVRVASGGVDCAVRIWLVRLEKDLKTCVEHRATLTRHERGVGTVRFAPPKQDRLLLASAADDAHIIVWKYDEGRTPMASSLEEEEESKEVWSTYKTLRGHVEDVCDLSWSRDGTKLASCGIDQSVFIWEVDTAKKLGQVQVHTHYVQGVSFDPLGVWVASLSADRTLRFYREFKKSKKSKTVEWKQKHKVHAIKPPTYDKPVRLWWDDSLPGFVRRLEWSPEGQLLACPGAELNPPPIPGKADTKIDDDVIKIDDDSKENVRPATPTNEPNRQKKECVAIFTRGSPQQPIALIPTVKPSVVTRWCPILFKLNKENPKNYTTLNYYMVLAVATSESGIGNVILYSTQTMRPICTIEGIHYANMTDLAWCPSGNHLFVSSRDGYVTRIDFEEGELGSKYEKELNQVISDLDEKVEEVIPEEEIEFDERLSPKLEKMILNSPAPEKRKPEANSEKPSEPKVRHLETKKSKKKVAFTTISSS